MANAPMQQGRNTGKVQPEWFGSPTRTFAATLDLLGKAGGSVSAFSLNDGRVRPISPTPAGDVAFRTVSLRLYSGDR